jgi:hypothetical protein
MSNCTESVFAWEFKSLDKRPLKPLNDERRQLGLLVCRRRANDSCYAYLAGRLLWRLNVWANTD